MQEMPEAAIQALKTVTTADISNSGHLHEKHRG